MRNSCNIYFCWRLQSSHEIDNVMVIILQVNSQKRFVIERKIFLPLYIRLNNNWMHRSRTIAILILNLTAQQMDAKNASINNGMAPHPSFLTSLKTWNNHTSENRLQLERSVGQQSVFRSSRLSCTCTDSVNRHSTERFL